jgi:protein SCO1
LSVRLASLLLLTLASSTSGAEDMALRAGVFSPPRVAPDFSLKGSNGSELKLSGHRGKVIVLAFGFTSCPDVCPTTLGVLAQAHKLLGAQGKDLQVIYVTVDPQRDDASRMRSYLAGFDPTFVGGTGTAAELAAVREAYGIFAKSKNVGSSYTVAHSSMNLRMRNELLRILAKERHTVVMVTHDVEEATHIADRILVLSPRPARIQATFAVSLRHPRILTGPEVQELRVAILRELGVDGFSE